MLMQVMHMNMNYYMYVRDKCIGLHPHQESD